MDRRQFLSALSLAGLAMSITSCAEREPLLRVSGNLWVGYGPLFLARSLDHFDPDVIRLIDAPSNTHSLIALANGEVDVAALTLDEFLMARSDGIDAGVIMVFDTSDGADVVMARPDIRHLNQLAGKRIGVEDSAVGALVLAKLLQVAGLVPEDVIKVPVRGDLQLSYYKAGKLDAVICFEPFASRLAEAGAHRLYDSSHFPNLIVDVLVARSSAMAQQPNALRTLLKGYFDAVDYMNRHPDDAYRRMAPRMQITEAEVRAAFADIRVLDLRSNHAWLAPGGQLSGSAQQVMEIMKANHFFHSPPSLKDLANPKFLPRLR